jgi:hypothetical protein
MKLSSMRRSAKERGGDADKMPMTVGGEKDKAPPPERDDIELRLEHHHIEKLGLGRPLPHGTKISFEGEGEVGDSGTHEGYSDAEPRHHMTIRIARAGIEHEGVGDDPTGNLRGEISKNTEKAETDRADKSKSTGAAKTEKSGAEPGVKG